MIGGELRGDNRQISKSPEAHGGACDEAKQRMFLIIYFSNPHRGNCCGQAVSPGALEHVGETVNRTTRKTRNVKNID